MNAQLEQIDGLVDAVAHGILEVQFDGAPGTAELATRALRLAGRLHAEKASEIALRIVQASHDLTQNSGEHFERPLKLLSRVVAFLQKPGPGLPQGTAAMLEELDAIYDAPSARCEAVAGEGESEADSSCEDNLAVYAQDPEMVAAFVGEAAEHLELAESKLLAVEANPEDMDALNAVFRSFHTVKGSAGFLELHPISRLAHAGEDLLDAAREGKVRLTGPSLDVILECLDCLKLQIESVRTTGQPPRTDRKMTDLAATLRRFAASTSDASTAKETPTIVAALVEVNPSCVEAPARNEAKNAREMEPTTAPAPTAPKTQEQGVTEEVRGPEKAISAASAPSGEKSPASAESIRVDRYRLDLLMDLIGELVLTESIVHEETTSRNAESATEESRSLTQLRKITRDLQELSLTLRMVPASGLFQKLTRLVRELSRKLGKEIDVVAEGSETELDKTIIDQVADPLIHIVRNSIDHGIECDAEERVRAGKPRRATITLRAFHRGGSVHIEVQDDGRGLNTERILQKARDQGLIGPTETPSEREIYNLIFAPGFSTAEKVTDVSGRGVGMDVVRRNIEALRGVTEIDSTRGAGTTISLRLPLTLAIIDGMIVSVAGQRLIVPVSSIVEAIRPQPEQLASVAPRCEILDVRGQNVPYFRLERVLQISKRDADPTEGIVVLVEDGNRLSGLLVDEIIGRQQVVIKSLGAIQQASAAYSGGAVLPDGRVGLILDVHGVLNIARSRRNPAAVPAGASAS
jgi:two-component system chemotaxis sensor kinase CheA